MRWPPASASVIASSIVLTASSASRATRRGLRSASRAINSDFVIVFNDGLRCALLGLRVELGLQQCTEVGGPGLRLGLHPFHRRRGLGAVLRLDRQVDVAVLAV